MSKIGPCLSLSLLGVSLLLLGASPAHAQATRTWVSGVGDDANPCSRTAPCKTFAGAISKTAPAGEINCLDPGGFGAVTITKALTIACDYTEGGVLAAAVNGIIVNAGVNDIVVLRGLDIHGAGNGLNGIRFLAGAALHVQKCFIQSFRGSPGQGIDFAPSGASELYVTDTTITDNNTSATSAGILVKPTGTGSATGILDNVSLLNNGNGLIVDGTGTTTGTQISIIVRNSRASGNANNGIKVTGAAGRLTKAFVDHTAITTNPFGISSTGQGADVTLGYSIVTGNTNTGLFFTAPAELRSYQGASGFGTNQIRGNVISNGTFSSTIPLE